MSPVNIIIVFLTSEIISSMVLMCYLVIIVLLVTVSPAALDYHKCLPNSHLYHPNLHRDNVSLYFVFFLFGFLCTSRSLGNRNFLHIVHIQNDTSSPLCPVKQKGRGCREDCQEVALQQHRERGYD